LSVRARKSALAFVVTVGLLSLLRPAGDTTSGDDGGGAAVGSPAKLRAAYERWKVAATRGGADRLLAMSLAYSKGLSARFTKARGRATVDLVTGSISAEVVGLPEHERFAVWLVDNRPGRAQSVKPEARDGMLRVGPLTPALGAAALVARLDREALRDFSLDLVVVARDGDRPEAGGLLYGSPSLFQRLYHDERRGRFASAGAGGPGRLLSGPLGALVPRPAHADPGQDLSAQLDRLVARGERLFFQETFMGNGRTCASCHPAENNFTIDPAFIATLPPRHPLFVAEFTPALAQIENPELLRKFGLILVNADGLDDPTRFVARGVSHLLALATSLTRSTSLPGAPLEMTGWSGDGSPDGTLRGFAIGAVTQHLTKRLDRVPGVDFRLPTPEELDALEAFQLSLGRQEDLDLATLSLADPLASAGQQLFMNGTGNPSAGGKCITCHRNAGALNLAAGENRNFNTRVEDRPDAPRVAYPDVPRDGGFGTASLDPPGCASAPSPACGFGDGRFNTVPLVEAADTGPFFHNNVAGTIETAIAHYTTPQFNTTQPGSRFAFTQTQIDALGAFLRVINAIENIRAAIEYGQMALGASSARVVERRLGLATHDTGDAIEVLEARALHPEAVAELHQAGALLQRAARVSFRRQRSQLIAAALALEERARRHMLLD
jgi:cytochrome c peroxidase